MSGKILFAFYDLGVSPSNYDFFTFVMVANLYRRKKGYSQVHFCIVPGPREGFRDDEIPPKDIPTRQAMLRNVVLPGSWLLEKSRGIMLLPNRPAAEHFRAALGGSIYPEGYNVSEPSSAYSLSLLNAAFLCGEEFEPLTVPHEALAKADDFIDLIGKGRKVITVTVRESEYHPSRNSNCAAWGRFLDGLNRGVYAPVVIRETNKAFAEPLFKDVPECPLASVDILFRAGLYQKAYLNMGAMNGPLTLALFMGIPLISFKVHQEDVRSTSKDFHLNYSGLIEGAQWPFLRSCQRYVWEDDSYDVINDEFRKMVKVLDGQGGAPFEMIGFSSPEHIEAGVQSVMNHLYRSRIHLNAEEDRELVLQLEEIIGKQTGLSQDFLGIWNFKKGDFAAALSHFERAVEIDPQSTAFIKNKANTHVKLDQLDEAYGLYKQLSERGALMPHDMERGLALAIKTGNRADIKMWLEQAGVLGCEDEVRKKFAQDIGDL